MASKLGRNPLKEKGASAVEAIITGGSEITDQVRKEIPRLARNISRRLSFMERLKKTDTRLNVSELARYVSDIVKKKNP